MFDLGEHTLGTPGALVTIWREQVVHVRGSFHYTSVTYTPILDNENPPRFLKGV